MNQLYSTCLGERLVSEPSQAEEESLVKLQEGGEGDERWEGGDGDER